MKIKTPQRVKKMVFEKKKKPEGPMKMLWANTGPNTTTDTMAVGKKTARSGGKMMPPYTTPKTMPLQE